jgi:hypothetical protein
MTSQDFDIAAALRQLVLAEQSVSHVARATGIAQATLHEFAGGRADGTFPDIRLSVAQRLIGFFGLNRLRVAVSQHPTRRKQRMRLVTELRVCGCQDSPQKFKERLIDRLVNSFPNRTIDDLVTVPDDARRFCDLIREEMDGSGLSDAAILKALMNIRRSKSCPPGLKSKRTRTNWTKFIRDAGISLDPERFYEQLVDGLASMYKDSTVDEMLCHPVEAKKYCDYMRRCLTNRSLSDEKLLRPLLNYRKSPRSRSSTKGTPS